MHTYTFTFRHEKTLSESNYFASWDKSSFFSLLFKTKNFQAHTLALFFFRRSSSTYINSLFPFYKKRLSRHIVGKVSLFCVPFQSLAINCLGREEKEKGSEGDFAFAALCLASCTLFGCRRRFRHVHVVGEGGKGIVGRRGIRIRSTRPRSLKKSIKTLSSSCSWGREGKEKGEAGGTAFAA